MGWRDGPVDEGLTFKCEERCLDPQNLGDTPWIPALRGRDKVPSTSLLSKTIGISELQLQLRDLTQSVKWSETKGDTALPDLEPPHKESHMHLHTQHTYPSYLHTCKHTTP